jgi:hypothetical protein
MLQSNVFRLTMLLLSLMAASQRLHAADEFESIFNGKDLTGWKVPADNPFWKVVDGNLVGTNDEKLTGAMLYTEASYKNFIVECDVRWTGHVDTGVMVRKPEIQMQLGISGSLKRDMSGSFYIPGGGYPEAGQAKNAAKLMKENDWNTFRLQAKDNTFTVWINGQKEVEYTNEKYKDAAPIGLQIHPKVKMSADFRNIKVKKLD